MSNIIWFVIMIPCSALFSGIGIYAMKRRKPMWFWSGSIVQESEIKNVLAYNRANGYMWLGFSGMLWLSTYAGMWNDVVAAIMMGSTFLVGVPLLIVVYNKIYKKYKV